MVFPGVMHVSSNRIETLLLAQDLVARTRASAVAPPMPEEAPVTMAVRCECTFIEFSDLRPNRRRLHYDRNMT
jgi:hypothetical protein